MTASGRVAILPDDVANQIAAGEVVERPASVVKELVENSLDAGATRITVDIVDAGRSLIRIVDDGSGMSATDAATAILRHATSKLRSADDLQAIETLGFRGEALPSIASVSRFTLVTQRDEDPVGTRIDIDGGGQPHISEAGAPTGTRIEVADLFFNVPARRKFLKSDATESAQIQQAMTAFALGYPHVHFRLTTNERTSLDFPAVKQLRDRAVQVLGRELTRRLHDVESDLHGIGVVGFVSAPQAAKSHANQVHLFVNGRRVRDRNLHHALVSAYGQDLGPGRFPQAVIYLHLPPADVDVNVHPAKAEVRFAHPTLVHQVLYAAVRKTLERKPWREDSPLPLERFDGRATVAEPINRYQPSLAAFEKPLPTAAQTRPLPFDTRPAPTGFALPTTSQSGPAPTTNTAVFSIPTTSPISPQTTSTAPAPAAPTVGTAIHIGFLSSGHALFELADTRLAIASPLEMARDLVRKDLLDLAGRGAVPARPLVMPVMVDLPPRAAKALRSRLPDLGHIGFWVESFGGTAFQVLGIPSPLAGSPARDMAAAVASALEKTPSMSNERLLLVLAGTLVKSMSPSETPALFERWQMLPDDARTGEAARFVPLPEVTNGNP